jgi:uncharacterized membrane protein YdbT with pleckstrin-like domain
MLPREVAEAIYPYTNDGHFMKAFKVILEHKIALAQTDLVNATDILTIGRKQGVIQVLLRLKELDVEVKAAGNA